MMEDLAPATPAEHDVIMRSQLPSTAAKAGVFYCSNYGRWQGSKLSPQGQRERPSLRGD